MQKPAPSTHLINPSEIGIVQPKRDRKDDGDDDKVSHVIQMLLFNQCNNITHLKAFESL
jgi:hypothetical protein